MTESIDPAEKLRAAQEYFRSLRIEGWEETNSPVQGGGQATILVVKRVDGARGAFRFTAEADEQTLERFSREIRILSGYEHPNILRILDHSKEMSEPWYMSELGEPFDAYWRRCRRQLADDPEQLVSSAVDIVRQLADGLAPLHNRGVVHRDIKPQNIIINRSGPGRERPVLIDFGLAHVESEPRLSDVHETVGNLRFSPDVAMYRMNNVPPWLDVHNLGQLLMWLARVHPDKDWRRALDWRWVNYDDRLSDYSALSTKALTALCSEQSVSPKNAGELITLIDQVFPKPLPSSGAVVNLTKIEEGRRRGMAASGLGAAEDTKIIEASFPIIAKTYLALRQELDTLFAEYSAGGIYVNKDSDIEIDTFRLRLLETKDTTTDTELAHWKVGESRENAFGVRISIRGIVPSRRSEYIGGGGQQFHPDLSNPFHFTFYFERPLTQTRGVFPHKTRVLVINDEGSLLLYSRFPLLFEPQPLAPPNPATATSVPGVVKMVKEWIEDPEVWEALYKYK